MRILLTVLLLVQVGGGFGDATVRGREVSTTHMEINIEVQSPAGGPVVAHLLDPNGVGQTIALAERSPGVFGGYVEVRRIDWVIVFEGLGNQSVQSQPFRISELGLDPALLGRVSGITATTRPAPEQPVGFGWLALGSGTAALALGLVWFSMRRREVEGVNQDPEP